MRRHIDRRTFRIISARRVRGAPTAGIKRKLALPGFGLSSLTQRRRQKKPAPAHDLSSSFDPPRRLAETQASGLVLRPGDLFQIREAWLRFSRVAAMSAPYLLQQNCNLRPLSVQAVNRFAIPRSLQHGQRGTHSWLKLVSETTGVNIVAMMLAFDPGSWMIVKARHQHVDIVISTLTLLTCARIRVLQPVKIFSRSLR
jgi:hypothetical protein